MPNGEKILLNLEDVDHILNILDISANTIDALIKYIDYSSREGRSMIISQLNYIKGLQMGLASRVKECKSKGRLL